MVQTSKIILGILITSSILFSCGGNDQSEANSEQVKKIDINSNQNQEKLKKDKIFEDSLNKSKNEIKKVISKPKTEDPESPKIPVVKPQGDYKPVIYLYPETEQDVIVQLNYNGKIIADYPSYNEELKGWRVKAFPDGKVINYSDNQEYSYLFWEGQRKEKINWDLSKGFVVKGEDTKVFLQKILPKMGLTPKEYNEFIVFWFPILQNNKYNLIHFADKQYTDQAALNITPEPESILRVFMVYKPLEFPIKIEEQAVHSFERKGFTVIEWGGTKAEDIILY
jgi:hypothetical protein